MNPRLGLVLLFLSLFRSFALPKVDVFVTSAEVYEGGVVQFVFHKTGPGSALVPFTFGGNAVEGKDFATGTGAHSITVPDNLTELRLLVYTFNDRNTNTQPILVLRLSPDPSYEIGDASLASVRFVEKFPNPTDFPPGVYLSAIQWSDHIDIQVRAADPDGIAAIWLYDNSQLLRSVTNPVAPLSFNWTNPPAGRHELSAIAMDKHGLAAGLSNAPPTVLIVGDNFTFPKEGASSTDGLTLSGELVTSLDTRERHRRLLLEFPIPPSATNSEGVLEFATFVGRYISSRTNEIFAYAGDGLLSTNDLFVAGEPVTRFVAPQGTNEFRLDISPVIREHAGGYLGLWINDAPDQQVIGSLGTLVATFSNFKLELLNDSTDEPTAGRLLAPPRDSNISFFESTEVALEIIDNDSRVTSVELHSAQSGLIARFDDLLFLGTNIVTLQWTNPAPGDHRLFLNTSNEDGIPATIELGQIHVEAIAAKVVIPGPQDPTRPAESPYPLQAFVIAPTGGAFAAELSVDAGPVVDRRDVQLPPGTNTISLTWTNPTGGNHTFQIRLSDSAGNATVATSANKTFILLAHEWLYSGDNIESLHIVDASGRAGMGIQLCRRPRAGFRSEWQRCGRSSGAFARTGGEKVGANRVERAGIARSTLSFWVNTGRIALQLGLQLRRHLRLPHDKWFASNHTDSCVASRGSLVAQNCLQSHSDWRP